MTEHAGGGISKGRTEWLTEAEREALTLDDYRAEIEEPLLQRIAAYVELRAHLPYLFRQAKEALEANCDCINCGGICIPCSDMFAAIIAAIDERILLE